MSTLAAHAAVGLLLGVGMRVRTRLLPLVPVIAVLPDLDHLARYGVPWLHLRMTFHNVFFCVALPLAVYGILVVLEAPDRWQDLAGKSPTILVAGLVTDVVAVEPAGKLGAVALFYPFDDRWWTVPTREPALYDPTAYGSVSPVLVALSLLALATWAWMEHVGAPGAAPTRTDRWRRIGVYALVWLLLFPVLAGAGLVTVSSRDPGPRLQGAADGGPSGLVDADAWDHLRASSLGEAGDDVGSPAWRLSTPGPGVSSALPPPVTPEP